METLVINVDEAVGFDHFLRQHGALLVSEEIKMRLSLQQMASEQSQNASELCLSEKQLRERIICLGSWFQGIRSVLLC